MQGAKFVQSWHIKSYVLIVTAWNTVFIRALMPASKEVKDALNDSWCLPWAQMKEAVFMHCKFAISELKEALGHVQLQHSLIQSDMRNKINYILLLLPNKLWWEASATLTYA